jgi:hypothetical protein
MFSGSCFGMVEHMFWDILFNLLNFTMFNLNIPKCVPEASLWNLIRLQENIPKMYRRFKIFFLHELGNINTIDLDLVCPVRVDISPRFPYKIWLVWGVNEPKDEEHTRAWCCIDTADGWKCQVSTLLSYRCRPAAECRVHITFTNCTAIERLRFAFRSIACSIQIRFIDRKLQIMYDIYLIKLLLN